MNSGGSDVEGQFCSATKLAVKLVPTGNSTVFYQFSAINVTYVSVFSVKIS